MSHKISHILIPQTCEFYLIWQKKEKERKGRREGERKEGRKGGKEREKEIKNVYPININSI